MRKGKTLWVIGAIVVVAIGLIIVSRALERATPAARPPMPARSEAAAPWPNGMTDLRARLAADGLPALPEEGNALHIHQHLDILIDGSPIAVPAGIGIDEAAGFIAPIHVHDTTGIVHVESPTVQDFTLGQFFDIWGVRLTADCIGGYCSAADKTLRVFVNGAPYAGDPRALVLAAHQEIVIAYGSPAELPKEVPATYVFPQGY